MIIQIILLITPFLFWYFFGFYVNDIPLSLNNENFVFVLATILSGLSIFLTVRKYGTNDNKVMLLFLLALACEATYSYFTKKYKVSERPPHVNTKILMVILLMFFVNSVRIYKQLNAKIYLGALCLVAHVLIIVTKFINE
jgi:hypothetical protein